MKHHEASFGHCYYFLLLGEFESSYLGLRFDVEPKEKIENKYEGH